MNGEPICSNNNFDLSNQNQSLVQDDMVCPPIKFKIFLNNICSVYIRGLFHGSKAKEKAKTKEYEREGEKEGRRKKGREGGEG